MLLFQADSLAVAALPAQDISLFELAKAGGFTMIVLLALSIYALYIFVERIMLIKKAQQDPEALLDKVKEAVLSGNIPAAIGFCKQHGTPMSRMLNKGLNNIGGSIKNIEASIENVGKLEIYRLEKNLSSMATISGAAPMIGFYGTVQGMIRAFIAIAQEEGSVSPKLLSSGIYEAMITTAGGLIVGIAAYIAYNYLVKEVSVVIHRMEFTSIEFVELLQKPQ